MRTKPVYLFTLFFLLPSMAGFGQNAQLKEADRLLSEKYPADEPGATVIIAKEGEILMHEAYGLANLELGVEMRPEMVFEIGSITKQFTAVAILKLMEEGKLSLEDDITKYISDYPTHGYEITIHDLLTHVSGIKSYTSMPRTGEIWRIDHEPSEMVDYFKKEPMDFAPGSQFRYNNSAYFLLGVIIEEVSGMSYEEYIEEKFFEALGMDNSLYGSQKEIVPNRAYGYQKEDEKYRNAEYLSMTVPYSAGSLMSTVKDLLTWNMALHAGKILSKNSLEKAFTNYSTTDGKNINYGYGWFLNGFGDKKSYEHSGGIFGYITNGIYVPEDDLFIAVFSNNESQSPVETSVRIAGIMTGIEFPDREDVIDMDARELEEYTGVYEFEDKTERIISIEEGQLYSMRSGGMKYKIFPYDTDRFLFENSLTVLEFNRDSKAEIVSVTSSDRIISATAVKTSDEVPEKSEIEVSTDILEKYTGTFELQPGFDITFTIEEGKFMSQATGQNKFQLFAESETVFFLKVVDAQIEFIVENDGSVQKAVLSQGGQEYQLKRK